jgi:hypothetical protein
MTFLDRLENKFGRFAIPGLISMVAGGQLLFWFAAQIKPGITGLLLLDPYEIQQGQWWRYVSWVLFPPSGLMGIFFIYWLYVVGRGLEQAWGAFRLNLYYVLGVAGTMVVGLVFGGGVTPDYLHLSLVLAFGQLYPDLEILLFFFLPLKMRWVAGISGALLIWQGVENGPVGMTLVTLCLANYVLFFGPMVLRRMRQQKQVMENRAVFVKAEQEVFKMPPKICVHCKAKAEDGADIRLCTCDQCGPDGRFWCMDHLKPHLQPDAASAKSGPAVKA